MRTNVILWERLPSKYLPPHPEIEKYRAGQVEKLRNMYQELCMAREGRAWDLVDILDRDALIVKMAGYRIIRQAVSAGYRIRSGY